MKEKEIDGFHAEEIRQSPSHISRFKLILLLFPDTVLDYPRKYLDFSVK